MSFINLLNKAIQAEPGDYAQLMDLNNAVEKLASDPAVMDKALLSFAGVFVVLVLSITSLAALIKTLKGKA